MNGALPEKLIQRKGNTPQGHGSFNDHSANPGIRSKLESNLVLIPDTTVPPKNEPELQANFRMFFMLSFLAWS